MNVYLMRHGETGFNKDRKCYNRFNMNVSKKTPENNLGIQEAITYFVKEVEEYCVNNKPLITHCIRVAFRLDFYGYDKEIVQAALLHDILEDTHASVKDIRKKFGKRVVDMVVVSTFDKNIVDKKVKYINNFDKALKFGHDALVIRASDILDNSFYYPFVEDKNVYKHLFEKLVYFLKISKSKIGKEAVYEDLKERLVDLKKNENSLLLIGDVIKN